jgi:hypothetical protein
MADDTPFSNRELKSMFQTISDKQDKTLIAVNETNGKVADIQTWRERTTGAMWVGGIGFTVIIIPLVTWALIEVADIETKIVAQIKQMEFEVIE